MSNTPIRTQAGGERELLELAAKAAGMKLSASSEDWASGAWSWNEDGLLFTIRGHEWSPRASSADAFELLCRLSLRIVEGHGGAYRAVQFTLNPEQDDESEHEIEIEWPHTPRATRYAITSAAAEIGRRAAAAIAQQAEMPCNQHGG